MTSGSARLTVTGLRTVMELRRLCIAWTGPGPPEIGDLFRSFSKPVSSLTAERGGLQLRLHPRGKTADEGLAAATCTCSCAQPAPSGPAHTRKACCPAAAAHRLDAV